MKNTKIRYTPIASTFSKDSSFWGVDFPVQYIREGQGAYLKGNDGKWYLDWVSSLGACLLGHGDGVAKAKWSNYLMYHARRGLSFSLPSYLEEEVAELLAHQMQQHVPGWANTPLQVRWLKTGSDACEAAVRLARAVTGKNDVQSFGYHGYHADFVSMTKPAWGIPPTVKEYMYDFEFNTIPDTTDCAGVILEQGLVEPRKDYYTDLRLACNNTKSLLIMDEVVTGFRYAMGGASQVYNVRPDLICLGKSLGNGFPIAALVGPTEYMSWFSRNDPVFVSSTNFGDAMSLAAAKYVLENWNKQSVAQIYEMGSALITDMRAAGWQVLGHAPRSLMQFASDSEKAYFIRRMAEQGILMNRPNFPNLCHTLDDEKKTYEAAKVIRAEVDAMGSDKLEMLMRDKLPTVLFRNR